MAGGLPGRLKKGAGTHLASWLQEVGNVPLEEAAEWLRAPREEATTELLAALKQKHGKAVGHSGPIIDAAACGQLLVTKDAGSMRLWRARDGTLLRVITACPGDAVAFSPSGNNIVTGTVGGKIKTWGPAGQSAVGIGNTKITAGKA
eukprot:TRINITY_DN21093_c0_g1_i1.p1 TRINITY_DN21093_c0_g1~~TRINITY_DN21093_c0_g1_i1.p1  ORF type:complete len:147 (+),score=27.75 TRINITY_DN21093_c0_g1_i1:102-542(+)